MSNKYKVGYIDEDITQVKIFTEALKEYGIEIIGYDITEGMSENQILDQVYNSDIDLLMIDYYLKDKGVLTFNGDELDRLFSDIKPNFPVIIFTSNEMDAFDFVDNPNIIYQKEMVLDDDKVEKFVSALKKNIENYRSYIEKRKHRISELFEKGEKAGLDASEKDELLTLQQELNALDKWKKSEVPKQLLSDEKLEDISKSRKEAEAFLKSLIANKKKG